LISSRRTLGWPATVIAGGAAALVAGSLFYLFALQLPEDAPLARMYRTEADLRALVTALSIYYSAHKAYPPPSHHGLRLATDFVSRNADYFPEGPPPDAWGRPFRYVLRPPYPQGTVSPADGFWLYSAGDDGEDGLDDPAKQHDNICSWDPSKSWRAFYRELNRTSLSSRRNSK
jgi:hypothetical protein